MSWWEFFGIVLTSLAISIALGASLIGLAYVANSVLG
jgi:hypothetical protein